MMWVGYDNYDRHVNYRAIELLKENGFQFGVVRGDCLVYEE